MKIDVAAARPCRPCRLDHRLTPTARRFHRCAVHRCCIVRSFRALSSERVVSRPNVINGVPGSTDTSTSVYRKPRALSPERVVTRTTNVVVSMQNFRAGGTRGAEAKHRNRRAAKRLRIRASVWHYDCIPKLTEVSGSLRFRMRTPKPHHAYRAHKSPKGA
jgi:hypothetical protein